MRLLLEVESRDAGQRRFWLSPGERLRIGRTEWADVALPEDVCLAGVHFEVESAREDCWVRDLSQRGGTYVNGQPVNEATLHSGDTIQAGQTQFRVAIDNQVPRPPRALSPVAPRPVSGGSSPAHSAAAAQQGNAEETAAQPPAVATMTAVHRQRVWTTSDDHLRQPANAPVPVAAPLPRQVAALHDTLRGTTLVDQAVSGLRVVLRAQSGPRPGFRIWLHAEQVLRVGGSELADVAFPDRQLAAVHFELFTSRSACYVQDFSAGQTILNGRPLDQPQRLRHGDILQAGKTAFSVELEGEAAETDAEHAGEPFLFEPKRTPSELFDCLPTEAAPSTAALVGRLSAHTPLYLVANFRKIGLSATAAIADRRDVFAAHPALVRRAHSLYLVSAEDGVDLDDVLKKGWGKDAVIALFSAAPQEQLLAQVRAAAASFSAPRILRTQLATAPAAFAEQLLGDVKAVLVESDAVAGWTLLANPRLAPTPADLGLASPR